MCGRYVVAYPKDFAERFGIDAENPNLESRYNVAPSQQMPVVVSDTKRRLLTMRWGLIPFWNKDQSANGWINARSETVATKPAFRTPFKRHRCLVPASGFYEWAKSESGKIPYYFQVPKASVFAFAGIYDIWKHPSQKDVYSYSILTAAANDSIKDVHHRMPIILNPNHEKT